MRLQVAFRTEKSKDSPEEKDSFFYKDNLFIVAEGVNGDYLGEMLKEKVCSGLAASFFKHLSKDRSAGMALVSALREINAEIIRERKRTGRKMAASVSVAYLLGTVMYFSHLGDSRIYCLHKGDLIQLTKDHTVGEEGALPEAARADRRLLRALTDGLGVSERPDVKVKTFALRKRDIILMTTEGLTRYLSNMQIQKLSRKSAGPKDLSGRLMEEARRKGAQATMTLGIIRYQALPQLFEGRYGVAGAVAGLLIVALAVLFAAGYRPRHVPHGQAPRADGQLSPKKSPQAAARDREAGTAEIPKEAAPRKPLPGPAQGRVSDSPVESTEETAAEKQPATHRQEIQAFLTEWKAAWEATAGEKGDTARYLSFYAEDFVPQGLDKSAWRREKEETSRKKSWIRVEIRDVNIGDPLPGNRVEVHFHQDYKSSNLSRSSKKLLILRKTDAGWRIVGEKSG